MCSTFADSLYNTYVSYQCSIALLITWTHSSPGLIFTLTVCGENVNTTKMCRSRRMKTYARPAENQTYDSIMTRCSWKFEALKEGELGLPQVTSRKSVSSWRVREPNNGHSRLLRLQTRSVSFEGPSHEPRC